MTHAYLAWADGEGLKGFRPESDRTQRQFAQQARERASGVTVWLVLDSTVLATVNALLEAGDSRAAWHCLLTHATHIGRL